MFLMIDLTGFSVSHKMFFGRAREREKHLTSNDNGCNEMCLRLDVNEFSSLLSLSLFAIGSHDGNNWAIKFDGKIDLLVSEK
jgi:hypothetical protein